MSAPTTELIPLAVVVSSLLGSLHCVGMCGGIAVSFAERPAALAAYHLGRLVGYVTLGALAGALGSTVLSTRLLGEIAPWVSALFLGGLLVALGARLWRGKNLHFAIVPASVTGGLFRRFGRAPLAAGALTALLPCGWLHSFTLGAAATGSAAAGAAFLFVFWLGTVPALSAAPALMRRALGPLARKAPRASAVVLMAAGLACIGFKISMTLSASSTTETHSCHHE